MLERSTHSDMAALDEIGIKVVNDEIRFRPADPQKPYKIQTGHKHYGGFW